MSLPELPPLSLYIHLPWCERKCPYCDFNSHEADHIPEAAYIKSLIQDLRGDFALVQGREIETLFIGGGTPSLFSAASIMRLMKGIASCVALSPHLEATMEANPGSAEAEKFLGFRDAGINRLSLGIQSFHDEQLQALGRVHNGDEAHAAIEMVRAAKFENFNIDLMHGLPDQSEAGAIADLRAALVYHPPHLSWYQLTVEPNTLFYKSPPVLPGEDTLADIQNSGEALLASSGYRQYEVSAYSQADSHCRHNLNYWSFGDYLGIGAGAHGKISFPGGRVTRYSKCRQPTAYMSAGNNNYTSTSRNLSHHEMVGEYMLNTLRLNKGFTTVQFSARTGLPEERIRDKIDALVDRKLLVRRGNNIRPSKLGRQFLDTVVAAFF